MLTLACPGSYPESWSGKGSRWPFIRDGSTSGSKPKVNLGVLGVLVVCFQKPHHQDTKNAKNTKPIGCDLRLLSVSVMSHPVIAKGLSLGEQVFVRRAVRDFTAGCADAALAACAQAVVYRQPDLSRRAA